MKIKAEGRYPKLSTQGKLAVTLGVLLTIASLYYVWSALSAYIDSPVKIVVYAFSSQEEVFTKGIFPTFETAWKNEHDEEIFLEGVFGPSGSLASQIYSGDAPVDIAIFSNARHVNLLKMGRLVNQDAEPVSLGASPLVIVVRTGNPDKITDFNDLAQPGLILLHADPRTSGVGEWSILAEYGSPFKKTGDELAGQQQLEDIWKNVCLVTPSAHAALVLFELGAGDALITYEQDARLALQKGVPLEIVIPHQTIITHPVAVIIDKYVTKKERHVVEAFMNFLMSENGQAIMSHYQQRSVIYPSSEFPTLLNPLTIDDFGGWSDAHIKYVNTLWEMKIQPNLREETCFSLLP